MSSNRLRLIGIVLSVLWITIIGIFGLNRIAVEVHRDLITCVRMQLDAKADPRCAKADVRSIESWCALKDMECRAEWPLGEIGFVAALCLGLPALGWLFAFVRQSRQRPALM